jgi:hypothetical protein
MEFLSRLRSAAHVEVQTIVQTTFAATERQYK